MLVSHEIELDEDAVDRLIDEVRAEFDCTVDDGSCDFARKFADDPDPVLKEWYKLCLSCAARAKLAVKV
jgi:hypothetical protein